MIACPWCGTSYERFQSNCKNCGGPIPARNQESLGELQPPPGTPRSIVDSYTRRLMMSDGMSIVGFIFSLIGGVFSFLGAGLTLGVVTAFVGVPFLLIGVLMLAGGVGLLVWRYQEKQKVVNVLRWGEPALGEVVDLRENFNVSINNRHPWIVDYSFRVNDQAYAGKVTTLREPGAELQPGRPVYVLYIPGEPGQNAIYPHP